MSSRREFFFVSIDSHIFFEIQQNFNLLQVAIQEEDAAEKNFRYFFIFQNIKEHCPSLLLGVSNRPQQFHQVIICFFLCIFLTITHLRHITSFNANLCKILG